MLSLCYEPVTQTFGTKTMCVISCLKAKKPPGRASGDAVLRSGKKVTYIKIYVVQTRIGYNYVINALTYYKEQWIDLPSCAKLDS